MTLLQVVVTALVTGLLGSIHCAAMCAPLVVAGCTRDGRVDRGEALGYFGGRILSYAAIGALLGHLGQHALCILPVGTVQAIAVGVVAVAAAARGIALLRRPARDVAGEPIVKLGTKPRGPSLVASIASYLPRRGAPLGVATGIMPCGMLLPAWALAAGTAAAPSGALVMAAFAIATAPGLLLPLAGRRLLARAAARLPAAAQAAAWGLLALYVALRPLLATAHHH